MTIKNYINTKLLNQFFPINDRVYENMLNDFCKHYEISSEFKSQKVFYSGDGYTVIPENERNFFKFIYAFKEIHNIDKSLFYLIPDVLVTHPLGVSIINNKRIIMNSVKNKELVLESTFV